MIAILDGPVIDNGVASEIGVAYAAKIPILGLYTDSRRLGRRQSTKTRCFATSCRKPVSLSQSVYHWFN